MTDSDTRAPRTNREGDPCPRWCTIDHDTALTESGHYPVTHASDPLGDEGAHLYARVIQSGYNFSSNKAPAITVTHGADTVHFLADDPVRLAELVEMLADVPFQKMLQLGQQLRAAAAIIAMGKIQ